MPDERGCLTPAENARAYRFRCVLQDWGFPADDLPIESAICGTEHRIEFGEWQLVMNARVLQVWHNSEPWTSTDPYGCRVADYYFGYSERPEVWHSELMPPIWKEQNGC